jgi:hypothetical protein
MALRRVDDPARRILEHQIAAVGPEHRQKRLGVEAAGLADPPAGAQNGELWRHPSSLVLAAPVALAGRVGQDPPYTRPAVVRYRIFAAR